MRRKPKIETTEGTAPMKIKEIMSSYLEVIAATDTVEHAAGRMRAFNIGCLLVQDEDGLVGMITDRDIAIRVAAAGKRGRETAVSEVMSPGLICLNEDQSPEEVARMMEVNQLYRLTLIDRDGHPTGIVTLGDLARNGFESLAARILITRSQSVYAISSSPWLR